VATATANGLEIAYEAIGDGPPLVLLHGATSIGRDDFAAQIPLLSKTFRLLIPDQRGHGRTRWDAERGFEERWLADDLAGFADALGLESFHLLGFSMGGTVALHFGARWPDRLRTVVIAGTSPDREPRTSVARRLMDPVRADRDEPAWAAVLARRHDAGQGKGRWRQLLPAIAADIGRQTLVTAAELHRVDAPALIAVGDRDPFVPVGQAWALQRQLPDARLLVVPGCGHEVTARAAGVFNEVVTRFYRSTQTAAEQRAAAWDAQKGRET